MYCSCFILYYNEPNDDLYYTMDMRRNNTNRRGRTVISVVESSLPNWRNSDYNTISIMIKHVENIYSFSVQLFTNAL
jgi:hypothetical protein